MSDRERGSGLLTRWPAHSDATADPARVWAAMVFGLAVIFLAVSTTASVMLEVDRALAVARPTFVVGSALGYLAVVLHPHRGGISVMVGFFFLFFVALPASVQVQTGIYPFKSHYFREELIQGYVLLGVAQLAYLLGLLVGERRRARATRAGTREMRPDFYLRAGAVLTLVAYLLVAVIGPGSLMLTRAERGEARLELGARLPLIFVGRSVSLVAAVIVLYLLVAYPARRRLVGLLLIVLAPAFLLLNWPPGLARFQLFGSALALLCLVVSVFSTRVKLLAATAAPVFLVLGFSTIKALGRGEDLSAAQGARRDVSTYLQSVDFDVYKQVIDTWIYVDGGNPLRNGENFLGVLFFWVPRALWEGKPRDSGLLVSYTLNYPYNNVSSPLPAEAYVSFGMYGIVAVMGLLGLVVAWLENRARVAQEDGGMQQAILLYALVVGFSTIILRGALNGVAPMFGTGFLIYFLLAWWHDRTSPDVAHSRSREVET